MISRILLLSLIGLAILLGIRTFSSLDLWQRTNRLDIANVDIPQPRSTGFSVPVSTEVANQDQDTGSTTSDTTSPPPTGQTTQDYASPQPLPKARPDRASRPGRRMW
jgi:hypothetical protein